MKITFSCPPALHDSLPRPELARRRGDFGGAVAEIDAALADPRLDRRTKDELAKRRAEIAAEGERDAALEMLTVLPPTRRRRTLGADKGYDTPDFIAGVRALGFTPPASPKRHRCRRRRTVTPGVSSLQRMNEMPP